MPCRHRRQSYSGATLRNPADVLNVSMKLKKVNSPCIQTKKGGKPPLYISSELRNVFL
jgi:hypothetical protein